MSNDPDTSLTVITDLPKPKKFIGLKNIIPDYIINNPLLNLAVLALPTNYNFEIYKSIWRIKEKNYKNIALQFPEGLLMYSCIISDILIKFCNVNTIIMADVTYGACCIDDFTALALGADFLIHYGHSCLIPIDVTKLTTMYVFVEIGIDVQHLISSIQLNFPKEKYPSLLLAGTVQFLTAIQATKRQLTENGYIIDIPQSRPLSAGEMLGCTAPSLNTDITTAIFVADGRFHLEAFMIANPNISVYKYDPYNKAFTIEKYDHKQMLELRKESINHARKCERWAVILGTLGRQGSLNILEQVESVLKQNNKSFIRICLSELSIDKLKKFDVDAFVQIACPRLSIDWGYLFEKPLLNSYELNVCMDDKLWKEVYPMDYYDANGPDWTNYAYKKKNKTKTLV